MASRGAWEGLGRLAQVLEKLKKSFDGQMPGLMDIGRVFIFLINFICYFAALLSFYLTEILTQFLYAILYVVSPLAFLCIIPNQTGHIAKNIYKGVIQIAMWRILWAILGAMLFEFISSPIANWQNFFMGALTNLCIGAAMLFIPFFTSSLLSDGGASVASRGMEIGRGLPYRAYQKIRNLKNKKGDGHEQGK